jgi:SAM-dependent methyltransferase
VDFLQEFDGVQISKQDIVEFAKRGQQFDACILLTVSEHLNDPAGGFEAIANCLKPGGEILLTHGNAPLSLRAAAYDRGQPGHLMVYCTSLLPACLAAGAIPRRRALALRGNARGHPPVWRNPHDCAYRSGLP